MEDIGIDIGRWNGLEEMDAVPDNWMTKISAMGTRVGIIDLWTTCVGPRHNGSGRADMLVV